MASSVGRIGLGVSFLRLNRSVILAVFKNLTRQQVELVIAKVKTEYPTFDYTDPNDSNYSTFKIQEMHASSIADGTTGTGYFIVQIDKIGEPVPWGMTEFIIKVVNLIAYTGLSS